MVPTYGSYYPTSSSLPSLRTPTFKNSYSLSPSLYPTLPTTASLPISPVYLTQSQTSELLKARPPLLEPQFKVPALPQKIIPHRNSGFEVFTAKTVDPHQKSDLPANSPRHQPAAAAAAGRLLDKKKNYFSPNSLSIPRNELTEKCKTFNDSRETKDLTPSAPLPFAANGIVPHPNSLTKRKKRQQSFFFTESRTPKEPHAKVKLQKGGKIKTGKPISVPSNLSPQEDNTKLRTPLEEFFGAKIEVVLKKFRTYISRERNCSPRSSKNRGSHQKHLSAFVPLSLPAPPSDPSPKRKKRRELRTESEILISDPLSGGSVRDDVSLFASVLTSLSSSSSSSSSSSPRTPAATANSSPVSSSRPSSPPPFLLPPAPQEFSETAKPAAELESGEERKCACKRTHCLQAYCECFSKSLLCTSACRCQSCENSEAHPNPNRNKSEAFLSLNVC